MKRQKMLAAADSAQQATEVNLRAMQSAKKAADRKVAAAQVGSHQLAGRLTMAMSANSYLIGQLAHAAAHRVALVWELTAAEAAYQEADSAAVQLSDRLAVAESDRQLMGNKLRVAEVACQAAESAKQAAESAKHEADRLHEHHLAQLADKDSILHHVEQQLSRLQQQFAAWQPCDDNEGCHPRWHTWAGGEDVDDDQESLSPDRGVLLHSLSWTAAADAVSSTTAASCNLEDDWAAVVFSNMQAVIARREVLHAEQLGATAAELAAAHQTIAKLQAANQLLNAQLEDQVEETRSVQSLLAASEHAVAELAGEKQLASARYEAVLEDNQSLTKELAAAKQHMQQIEQDGSCSRSFAGSELLPCTTWGSTSSWSRRQSSRSRRWSSSSRSWSA
eukprot:jgi/Chrzof1/3226/Cz12g16200.t1